MVGEDADKWSSNTKKEIEEEIEEKDLNTVVEEICARERFNVKILHSCKRYCSFYDNEEDEVIKKIRALGIRKLVHDTDINRIFKKIRNFEIQHNLLLTERQKYLLKFNAKNVIAANSSEYSSNSRESIFSIDPKEEDRNMVIR